MMLIAFFDSKGLIHHKFVPSGQTVNAAFYLQEVMKHNLGTSHPSNPARVPWSRQLDVVAWQCAVAHRNTFDAANQTNVLSHPPYSPDLAPADYFLFPKIKMKGHFYNDIPAIQRACTEQLRAISENDFHRAFEQLYERCNEGIIWEGYYVEGWCE